LLPAGAVAGWGLHPLESAALSRRTPNSDMTLIRRPQKKKPPRRRLFNTGRCGVGQRFSHVYSRPTQPLQDSQRVRRRVAALIGSMRDLEGLSEDVIGELGVEPHPTSGSLLPG
jgi:hypothetical protein